MVLNRLGLSLLLQLYYIGVGFHKGLALDEIEVKDMVDVGTNGHFVHIVIVIQALIVSLHHRQRKLLFLVELPTVFGLLQLSRVVDYFRFV